MAFRYNPEQDAIDIGGHDFAKRKKFRDVLRDGRVSFVVDDVVPPWQPRAVEVRGYAEVLDSGGKTIMAEFDDPIFRIRPSHLVSWGLDDEGAAPSSRRVSPTACKLLRAAELSGGQPRLLHRGKREVPVNR